MDTRPRTPHGTGDPVPVLTVRPLDGCHGVRAAGEIVLATHPVWERVLEQAVREGGGVYHLELSGVTFADVAGAGALAAAAERLGDGRWFVVRRPPPTLRRVLEMFWPDLPTIEVSMS
ncbi:STAS domain-containing protein [Streptomyces griseomycini]|uniref:Anti-anti-sigma regulatory factor n=1 Tax=Streptomyces griseomycini TaxID=66895 RepID=A0A7W7LUI8_9ACTN|nr:STAS domain-containing protein [Streptomyces griseomycini]MBB4896655.1 anti-anti-sigma regulatory factor [Streptomyces griseomycini]